MASYTSRIVLVLAVPSIVGILSILFFNRRKKLNSIRNTETGRSSLSTDLQCPMKLKHNQSCCIEDSAEMQLKEESASSETSTSTTKTYANCLKKQIRTRDVVITANGVQDVENSDIEDMSVTAVSRVEVANGSAEIKVKNSINKAEAHVIEKQIAEFSYYDTGARPKVKKNHSFQNGSSMTERKENGANIDNSRHNSASCSSKICENSEKPVNENGERKVKIQKSTNNINKSESTHSNGVSHFTLKSKRNKRNVSENNTSCVVTTISKCGKDKPQNDSINKLSNGVHAVQLSDAVTNQEQTSQNSEIKIMDLTDSGVQSNKPEEVRTINEQVDENINKVSVNSLPADDFIVKSETVDESCSELACNGIIQCATPESGRSSSSSEIAENTIDVNKNLEFSQDFITSSLKTESMIGNPESAYCESVESNDSGKGGSEILFGSETQSTSMIYEFDFPSAHCGVLIGKKGSFINQLKYKSNASVWIRNFPFDRTKKIVTIGGDESEINTALSLIRDKFPLCKYPDVTLEPTSFDSAQIICPASLKLALPEGVEFQVVLSATVNASNFFVQLPTHPSYHALQPFTISMTSMYTHCDTPTITNPSIGNIVAAPVGEGWFRAEIVEVLEDETCKLKYLDYGGYQIVPTSEIRKINIEYMQMPFQATECYLANVSCFDDIGWTVEAKTLFEELAQGQILSAYVAAIAENGVPCLYLYQVNGATNTFINQALVEAGFLKWDTCEQEGSS